MGFRNGAYAKVWDIDEKYNIKKARISISRKNKETNEYETEFNGFAALFGEAKKVNIVKGDKIKINSCDVTNKYDHDKGVEYTNFAIFECEVVDSTPKPDMEGIATKKKGSIIDSLKPIQDEDVPF